MLRNACDISDLKLIPDTTKIIPTSAQTLAEAVDLKQDGTPLKPKAVKQTQGRLLDDCSKADMIRFNIANNHGNPFYTMGGVGGMGEERGGGGRARECVRGERARVVTSHGVGEASHMAALAEGWGRTIADAGRPWLSTSALNRSTLEGYQSYLPSWEVYT